MGFGGQGCEWMDANGRERERKRKKEKKKKWARTGKESFCIAAGMVAQIKRDLAKREEQHRPPSLLG